MADREDLLESLIGDTPAETTANDTPPVDDTVDPVDTEIDPPAEVETPEDSSAFAGKETAALLDALTDGGEEKKPEPASDAAEKPAAEVKPEDKPTADKTLEEQEAEALEGVKSERGKERIKAVFAERRELETKAQQLEADINEFREMVKSTGMKPDEFAQTLEFGRLLNSGDEQSLRVALQMVDAQREAICKQLGIEAPGVDPLSDFPELKQAVENMEVTPAHALQLAKYKRAEQAKLQAQQAEQASRQEMQAFQQTINQAAQTAESYFNTRKHEADYPAKMRMIQEKFKDPAYIQEFVQTYEPKQWFGVFKLMYDSMVVPQAPQRTATTQPIRSRPAMSGMPASNPNASTADRLMSHLDSLGL